MDISTQKTLVFNIEISQQNQTVRKIVMLPKGNCYQKIRFLLHSGFLQDDLDSLFSDDESGLVTDTGDFFATDADEIIDYQ